jgi:hypothetical protein
MLCWTGSRVLLNECEAISGDRHIGLHLVDLIDIHSYGLFGYLLANSPMPRLLLETAARYYPIFHRYSELELSVADGVARVEYRDARPGRDDRRHDNEWSLGAFVTLTRARIDPSWMPSRVTFTNESPGELTELHRVFGTDLEFRQPVNCFEFDAALLDHEGLEGDPDLFEILVAHADGLLAQTRTGKQRCSRSRQVSRRGRMRSIQRSPLSDFVPSPCWRRVTG